jgi:hypothetical protein
MGVAGEREVRTAIVLQGGGALGAYEYGVLKALYEKRPGFRPSVVAGVSIGAITAAVLVGAKDDPIRALEQLWEDELAVPSPPVSKYVPGALGELGDAFSNPALIRNAGMYRPNARLVTRPWAATSYYDIQPLRRTLHELIDPAKLNAGDTRAIVTATKVQTAELASFDTGSGDLSIEQVIASACLPPSFPMIEIDKDLFWDGGLLSNLPLSPAINALEEGVPREGGPELELIVVELFPRNALVPRSLPQVVERTIQLIFASKLVLDERFFAKIDQLVDLMSELDRVLPGGSPVRQNPAYQKLDAHRKIKHFNVVTSSLCPELSNSTDFSPDALRARTEIGYKDAVAQGIGRIDAPMLRPGVTVAYESQ